MKDIWVEKYRPKTVDEYVFKDEAQKHQVKTWITDGGIPHLLFSGSAGTGKTTLAKVLINDLGVQDADVLLINASRDNGVDLIRRKITNFSETMPWGDYKVILLDEADYISAEGQAALRGVMEQYHQSVRFILTCNYPNKIIPALHSKEADPWMLIAEAGAIAVLAAAAYLMSMKDKLSLEKKALRESQ